ncbi:MAG: hypothetical protein COA96_08685 [SAR86 cluster bacterium]|uniref:Tetracycline repressor TetR C-terminal domain-containing protein n=1 Tax=SAR86 cluster bacterium TaxID=2030880 RepID=A0A2A5AZK6_9GAMM|nr:MAG: hypothetical protein COA96_08685 [SAR86 cluster bacterium]
MHSVARKLGVSTTALYRHVESRDTLINLCMGELCGRIKVPRSSLEWREYLWQLGHEFRRALLTMPGSCTYGFKIGPSIPAVYAIIEGALSVLVEAGFRHRAAWQAYALVIDHAFVLTERQERFAATLERQKRTGTGLSQINNNDPAAFPVLAKVMSDVMPLDFGMTYDSQLGCLLDGIECGLKKEI